MAKIRSPFIALAAGYFEDPTVDNNQDVIPLPISIPSTTVDGDAPDAPAEITNAPEKASIGAWRVTHYNDVDVTHIKDANGDWTEILRRPSLNIALDSLTTTQGTLSLLNAQVNGLNNTITSQTSDLQTQIDSLQTQVAELVGGGGPNQPIEIFDMRVGKVFAGGTFQGMSQSPDNSKQARASDVGGIRTRNSSETAWTSMSTNAGDVDRKVSGVVILDDGSAYMLSGNGTNGRLVRYNENGIPSLLQEGIHVLANAVPTGDSGPRPRAVGNMLWLDDVNNFMYCCTESGFYRYNLATGVGAVVALDNISCRGFVRTNSLTVGSVSNLFVCTREGLYRINDVQGAATEDQIGSVTRCEDGAFTQNGNIVVAGHTTGVFRIDPNTGNTTNITPAEITTTYGGVNTLNGTDYPVRWSALDVHIPTNKIAICYINPVDSHNWVYISSGDADSTGINGWDSITHTQTTLLPGTGYVQPPNRTPGGSGDSGPNLTGLQTLQFDRSDLSGNTIYILGTLVSSVTFNAQAADNTAVTWRTDDEDSSLVSFVDAKISSTGVVVASAADHNFFTSASPEALATLEPNRAAVSGLGGGYGVFVIDGAGGDDLWVVCPVEEGDVFEPNNSIYYHAGPGAPTSWESAGWDTLNWDGQGSVPNGMSPKPVSVCGYRVDANTIRVYTVADGIGVVRQNFTETTSSWSAPENATGFPIGDIVSDPQNAPRSSACAPDGSIVMVMLRQSGEIYRHFPTGGGFAFERIADGSDGPEITQPGDPEVRSGYMRMDAARDFAVVSDLTGTYLIRGLYNITPTVSQLSTEHGPIAIDLTTGYVYIHVRGTGAIRLLLFRDIASAASFADGEDIASAQYSLHMGDQINQIEVGYFNDDLYMLSLYQGGGSVVTKLTGERVITGNTDPTPTGGLVLPFVGALTPTLNITTFDGNQYSVDFGTGPILVDSGVDYTVTYGSPTSGFAVFTEADAARISKITIEGPEWEPDLSIFSGLTGLTEIDVGGSSTTGTLADLSGLTALERIYVNASEVTGSIASVSGLTALERLQINNRPISGNISALAGLTNLTHFIANATDITGDVSAFVNLVELKSIAIQLTALTGNTDSFVNATTLERINIRDTNLDGDGIGLITNRLISIDLGIGLTGAEVDDLISAIIAEGNTAVEIDISYDNAGPTSASAAEIQQLEAGGSTVAINPIGSGDPGDTGGGTVNPADGTPPNGSAFDAQPIIKNWGIPNPSPTINDPTRGADIMISNDETSVWVVGEFLESATEDGLTTESTPMISKFSLLTGEWQGVSLGFDATIFAIKEAPGGQTVYVAGNFRNVDGVARNRIAEIDVATGQLTDWQPTQTINRVARDLVVTNDHVYVCGFHTNGFGDHIAKFDRVTGAPDNTFQPNLDRVENGSSVVFGVRAMVLGDDGLWVAGDFNRVDGSFQQALALLDPDTGASIMSTGADRFEVIDMVGTSTHIFLALGGAGGSSEGIDRATGQSIWVTDSTDLDGAGTSSDREGGNLQCVAATEAGPWVYYGGHHESIGGTAAQGGIPVDRMHRVDKLTGEPDETFYPRIDGSKSLNAIAIKNNFLAFCGDFNRASGSLPFRTPEDDNKTFAIMHGDNTQA